VTRARAPWIDWATETALRSRPGRRSQPLGSSRSTKVMASSGHAAVHRPHPLHSWDRGVRAVLRSRLRAFNRPTNPRELYSESVRTPSSNTEYGQTFTQSSLPSHFPRSIVGTQRSGGARHCSPVRRLLPAAARALAGSSDPPGSSRSPSEFSISTVEEALRFRTSAGGQTRSDRPAGGGPKRGGPTVRSG
jgi:hypothetical protein